MGVYSAEEEDMADVLVEEAVDLNDAIAVVRALIAAGFRSSDIATLREKAIAEARYLIATRGHN